MVLYHTWYYTIHGIIPYMVLFHTWYYTIHGIIPYMVLYHTWYYSIHGIIPYMVLFHTWYYTIHGIIPYMVLFHHTLYTANKNNYHQNEVALSYHSLHGLYFLEVLFEGTVVFPTLTFTLPTQQFLQEHGVTLFRVPNLYKKFYQMFNKYVVKENY